MKNLLVVYLISIYDKREYLKNFLEHYKNFKSGEEHKLLICFKNFENNDTIFECKKLQSVNYIKYLDNNDFNDFDWGSYRRISKIYKDEVIFFMNCHSYPLKNNWLSCFVKNYEDNSILGPAGSLESMVNSALKGIHVKNKFKSYFYALSNFIHFPLFPNPHIRSNCFMISSKNFLSLKLNTKYKYKKIGTWINESGRKGMTNYFKKKKFKIYVINSDGKKFEKNNWILSQTYACGNQSKLIISDKFSRLYDKAEYKEKEKIKKYVWG